MRLGSCVPLFACALLISSCNRRPPPVVTVTPTSMDTLAIQSANREFALGDYVSAARDYERYLQLVPSGGDRDQALFHLVSSIPSLKANGRTGPERSDS